MNPVRVLVTDAGERSALAVVRSLGRAGHLPFTCGHETPSLAGSSRYAVDHAPAPDPLKNVEEYRDVVRELAHRWSVDMLIPISDASLMTLLPVRERLVGVRIPWPDFQSYAKISDKAQLMTVARELGIAVPRQVEIHWNTDDWQQIANLRYPLVVKPRCSIAAVGTMGSRLGIRYAGTESQIGGLVSELPRWAFPVLLQERINGPGIGIFLLRWNRETIALFSHRRIREKPPSGGVSVYRESTSAPAELVAASERLLDAYGWEGVAMVEYKLDESTDTAYLMEVNGRFWGSLQLAVDAGVDFPALLVQAAMGACPTPVLSHRTGIRSRWWWGDVDHLLARLREPRRPQYVTRGLAESLKALLAFLILWRPGDRSEVLRLGDLRPFLVETRNWIAQICRAFR